MKVIPIWDGCGEGLEVYELEGYLAELALAANGQYVNQAGLSEDEPVYELSEALEGLPKAAIPLSLGGEYKLVVCGWIP